MEKVLNWVHVSEANLDFNGIFYSQIKGHGMKGSLFPLHVIFICTILKKKVFCIHILPHWFKYVDDTFVLVSSSSDFSSSPFLVNSIDSCIQFTFEVLNDNSLSFLDILVSKHIDRFSTIVFRKSFSVSLLPHALSIHIP